MKKIDTDFKLRVDKMNLDRLRYEYDYIFHSDVPMKYDMMNYINNRIEMIENDREDEEFYYGTF